MTPTLNILIFISFLAYYYFVLRKYNSLGLRMFSIFSFVALAVVYWWYEGYQDLESLKKNGVFIEATVTQKSIESSKTSSVPDKVVGLSFTNTKGQQTNAEARDMTSIEEYEAVAVGQKVPAIVDTATGKVQLKSTFERSQNDYNYILIFPAILFLIGLACMIFLRKFKVQAHEGTVYEYLTDENGKVIFDDKQSATTRTIKKVNLFSKFMQVFGK